MRYNVSHRSRYEYRDAVTLCHNLLHLHPRETLGQAVSSHQLKVEPAPTSLDEYQDAFGNHAVYFVIHARHQELDVLAQSVVEVNVLLQPEPSATPPWNTVRESVCHAADSQSLDACPYLFDSAYVHTSSDLRAFAEPSFAPGRPVLEAALDLTRRIHQDFSYAPGSTNVATPLMDVLRTRKGVCQDFAHLEIGCLRAMGLPARYVSGYLVTKPPPGKPKLRGADDSHAWLALFCPGHGWLDLDPTNNMIPRNEHITLAWGRDYGDVAPIKGLLLGGGPHTPMVEVDVEPL
jgi:transglutaminase-like putative cysteine protease